MQNDQLAKVKMCVPEGTNSQQVTDRVVAYLRTKAERMGHTLVLDDPGAARS